VPKTGQLIQKLSIYQSVTKKHVVLGYIGKMDIGVLQVPSHQANERGFRRPKSKNRSTVKVRFRHPSLALREKWTLTYLAYDVSLSSLKCLLYKVRTNDDYIGWSVIGLQVNLNLPWRKMGEPQRGDGAFSNTPPTPFRLSPSL
jgi:hypothetical protein